MSFDIALRNPGSGFGLVLTDPQASLVELDQLTATSFAATVSVGATIALAGLAIAVINSMSVIALTPLQRAIERRPGGKIIPYPYRKQQVAVTSDIYLTVGDSCKSLDIYPCKGKTKDLMSIYPIKDSDLD
jgi:hypothetical protein